MLAIVSFGSRIIDFSGSEYWELAPDKTVQVAGDNYIASGQCISTALLSSSLAVLAGPPSTIKIFLKSLICNIVSIIFVCLLFCQSSEPLISKQVSHVSLPQIRSPVARQKSFFSVEKYPVTIHKPTATRTTRQVGAGFY